MHDRTHVLVTFALVVVVMLAAIGIVTARLEAAQVHNPPARRTLSKALLDAGLKDDTRVDMSELGRLVSAGLVHTTRTHLVVNAVALLLVSLFWWRVNVSLRRVRHAGCPAIALVSSTAELAVLPRAPARAAGVRAIYGILAAVMSATWALARTSRACGSSRRSR